MGKLNSVDEVLAAAGVNCQFANALLVHLACGKCGRPMLAHPAMGVPRTVACANQKCELFGVAYKVPKFPLEKA
jgi:hypothetical protein